MDLIEAQQRGSRGGARHPWELARLQLIELLIARHATLGPGASLLDVGCGDTFVVEQLASGYPHASFHAVDTAFTDEQVAWYRSRLAVRNVSLSTSLDAASLPPGTRASIVLLMDVLEHVADDHEFLRSLLAHRAVGADAWVIVTVPAGQALFCSHDRVLGHYRRYSGAQLQGLLEGAGLTVVETAPFFASLVPLRAVQVLRERVLGSGDDEAPTGLATWSRGDATTAAITRLLMADVKAASVLRRVGITLPGLSHFAVCRRPLSAKSSPGAA